MRAGPELASPFPASEAAGAIGTDRTIKSEEPKYPVKLEDHDLLDNVTNASPEPETGKQNSFHLQSLLANATPEVLETSVEQGVTLLDKLKVPMIDKMAQDPDSAQWMQQISQSQFID